MPRRKLTAVSVDKLRPPSSGRVVYFDTLLPGFALRISASGVKSWVLVYRFQRRQRRKTLGRYPVLSLAEAREKARDDLQQVAAGVDPAAELRAVQIADSTTFATVAAEFVEKYAKPRTRSWPETARILERDILPIWGDRGIGTITRADVLRLLDSIVARGAPVMANAVLAAVRKLFNWAVERGFIDVSPAAGISAPTRVQQRDRVLSDDELKAVWHACAEIGYPYGPLIRSLIVTAQRSSEVASLKRTDLDLVKNEWTIPGSNTKSGRSHTVPLPDLALSQLQGLVRLNSSPYVFTTRGDVPVSGFSKAKKRIDAASGVTDWRIHDLRRTAASGMARLGTPVAVISKVLNHQSSSAYGGVTAIYNRHAYEDEKRAALAGWCQHVTELI